jgi:hypothetical protein
MEKDQQMNDNLIQDEAAGELDEKKLWKEKLREEILEEEKVRILKFVKSEVTKKLFEIEKLLEIGGKPHKSVLFLIDQANIPQLRLPLEQGSSLWYQLANTGTGISPSPLILDSGINGDSKQHLSMEKDGSAENPMITVEEAKAEV